MRQVRLITASSRNGRDKQVMTALSVAGAVEVLRPLRQHSFAQSLIADYDRYGAERLGGNRAAWLMVLAQEALDRQEAERGRDAAVGEFEGIVRLFQTAGKHLKFPKIELETADGRPAFLALAGERSQYAGSVNVTSGHKYGDPEGKFYGRIAFNGSTGIKDEGVLELLRRFAADPAGTAAEYGRRVGRCCYCRIRLTDERSLAVGYGPICADRWGLPYPTEAQLRTGEFEAERQFAAAERQQELVGFASDPDYRNCLRDDD